MQPDAQLAAREVDRLVELVSIGTGHAASAYAALTGETCWMTVPKLLLPGEGSAGSALSADGLGSEPVTTGVFFRVRGALDGTLAVLLPELPRNRLLERLVGRPIGQIPRPERESALREVGNILASHVVSAMAETIGEVILPSAPAITSGDVRFVLAALVALRREATGARVESTLCDRDGTLRAVLVFVPGS